MKRVLLFLIGWLSIIGTTHAQVDSLYSPKKMTALVGPRCVINQIDKNLVEAVASTSDLGNIVDKNLNNYASLSSALSATVAYNPTIAVKDMKQKYAAGVTTGFVIQANDGNGTNLLSANILQMFWVETYLDGVKQETSKDTESTGGTLLNLNLLTIAPNGKTQIAVKSTKPFNEVRLSVSGVNADVLSQLKIYYAFVGENPIVPITKTIENGFPDASIHASSVTGIGNEWTTAMWNWPSAKENLIGAGSEEKGVGFGTLSSLLTEPRVTINAGKTIPANTEIGFLIETGTVLAINILNNTVLTTYDANDNQVDSRTVVSVLGISALGGGKSLVSMVTTAPCNQIKIKFGGLNVDVGGTKIYYAYMRNTEVKVPESCELEISADIVVCSDNQTQINGPAGVQWSIISQPNGASATINTTGLISNMTEPGDYVVKGILGNCEKTVTVTKSPLSLISYDCNRPIVGENIATFSPEGGGCLLCLATGTTGTVENILDENLTNYIEYTQGLDLASNTSIIGVQNPHQPYSASESAPRRVGFVMQATNQFLNVNLLKFFVIKTYLDGVEQESSLVDQNNAIGADLIAGLDNQVRYSFTATKNFNQVALWTAGLLNLNISKFRIYYAFEEPANDDCLVGNGSAACVSLLSSEEYGAQIAYNHTGFGGLANVGAFMVNLSNALDGDMNSYALINKVAGVGSSATLSIKTNRIIGNGYQAGFIIQDQTWVTNADLLSQVRIKTYLNGIQTGDEFGTPAVLSLDLIGSGDRAYLTVLPTQPFDEIQLDLSGLLDAAVNTKVFGAFIRKDTDNDGTPDCIDKNPCGEEFIITNITPNEVCVPDSVFFKYTGGKENATYKVWDGTNEYTFNNEKLVGIPTTHGGVFEYTIRENDIDLTHITATVHARQTKWTGEEDRDWNNPNNWTEGVPGGCTNVVILEPDSLIKTNGINYPILVEGGSYKCAGIHFQPGAEVVGTNYLEYEKAWVEIGLLPDRNYMVSIPVHDTYLGDLFVGGETYYDDRELFSPLEGEVQRKNPAVSTRLLKSGRWVNNTATLDTPMPSGFSIKLVKGIYPDSTRFVFRFAKEDTQYYDYDDNGNPIGDPTSISRSNNVGRFVYENENRVMPDEYIDTIKVAGKYLVVGNPFMCHLDVGAFIDVNGLDKDYVRVYRNATTNPNIAPAQTEQLGRNGKVAPMEAFIIEYNSNKTAPTLIKFTKNMMIHGNYTPVVAPQTKSANQGDTGSSLNLSSLKAYTQNGEGVIESSEKIQKLQVFTVAGSLIIEKQNVNSPVRIPLSDGVNMIRVQTEKETKSFKLIK